jgi:Tannase and feruloyl esterase
VTEEKIMKWIVTIFVVCSMALLSYSKAQAGGHLTAHHLSSSECDALKDLTVAAQQIGMPTRGASTTDAHIVKTLGTASAPVGDYCLVSGNIRPLDENAPNIEFQVALPIDWNSKALMLGGGGWDGTIPKIAENYYNTAENAVSPLGRGYAVFGSDGGHKAPTPAHGSLMGKEPGSFLLNEEALQNYLGDALKKTHDVALIVINAAYKRPPLKSYYLGGSGGGREAFQIIGRWPMDYDGVIALYPGTSIVTHVLGYAGLSRALAEKGAFVNSAKRGVLFQAALAACDNLDGVSDGVISAVKRCSATFNPSTASLNGIPIRCSGGEDTGDTCLSDKQLGALAKLNRPLSFNFTLAGGYTSFPGINVYTSDTGIPSNSPLQPMISWLALGSAPPTFPANDGMALSASFADNFLRYGVARNLTFNPLLFDPSNPGPLGPRLSDLSANDRSYQDLSRFASHGGKLLVMHGTADLIASVRMTEEHFEHLEKTMGALKVASFYRFYEVPGFNHTLSTNFSASWDYLTALENWVEKGVDPASNQIVTDAIGVPGRTRPLCLYPTWPMYKGLGDVNKASSFKCVAD